jgi:hypothetical protein
LNGENAPSQVSKEKEKQMKYFNGKDNDINITYMGDGTM